MSVQKDPAPEHELKIIPINPAVAVDLEIRKKASDTRKGPCYGIHKRVEIDEQNREVKCVHCGFVIDPFDYLLSWATEGDRRMQTLETIKIKTRIACAEHDDLMRKIKNARAALKRRGQPQPDVERQRYDMMRCNPGKVVELGLYEKGDEPA
ncbi:MAG TPA: hypothetical protein VNQ90_00070 [Chthoniobacteraceae bacterium]|nr:hypothetical protein [Chthoniobacteraceae bacterium]